MNKKTVPSSTILIGIIVGIIIGLLWPLIVGPLVGRISTTTGIDSIAIIRFGRTEILPSNLITALLGIAITIICYLVIKQRQKSIQTK